VAVGVGVGVGFCVGFGVGVERGLDDLAGPGVAVFVGAREPWVAVGVGEVGPVGDGLDGGWELGEGSPTTRGDWSLGFPVSLATWPSGAIGGRRLKATNAMSSTTNSTAAESRHSRARRSTCSPSLHDAGDPGALCEPETTRRLGGLGVARANAGAACAARESAVSRVSGPRESAASCGCCLRANRTTPRVPIAASARSTSSRRKAPCSGVTTRPAPLCRRRGRSRMTRPRGLRTRFAG
jgi:hypothetical protein